MHARLLLLLAMCASSSLWATTLTPCLLQTPSVAMRLRAECGEVVVSDTLDGKNYDVRIGFAVVKAKRTDVLPDPLVFLAGGPGQSSTAYAAVMARVLNDVGKRRDLVFVDARGTGRSMAFACKDKRSLAERLNANDTPDEATAQACVAQLPLPPRLVTTARIASDLEAVRTALAAPQLNLIGVSYGTRVAQAYDAMFPGHARTLVLDGVVPPSMAVGDTAGADADAAVARLAARCQAEKRCQSHDIAALVEGYLTAADPTVTVPHPQTGEPVTFVFSRTMRESVLRTALYAEESTATLIPMLVDAKSGRFDAAAHAALKAVHKGGDDVSEPMHLAVLCAEDVPRLPSPPSPSRYFGDAGALYRASCPAYATTPTALPLPASPSNTPALLLSGSADPITPPARAEQARQLLANSKHIVGEGVGHGMLMRGCVSEIVAEFVQSADPTTVDATCVKRLKPFPLFIDNMGPSP